MNFDHQISWNLAPLWLSTQKLDHERKQVEGAASCGFAYRVVVAGVVGIRKFAYDVWGHSVNFASRMEASGVPARVNISESTFELVKDFFICEERGLITTKDRRDVKMFLVEGVQPHLIADGGTTQFKAAYERRFKDVLPFFPEFLLFTRATKLTYSQSDQA